MKKHLFYIIFLTVGLTGLQAQNVSINTDGADPDPSAMLDVSDTASGFLIPRMTAAQRLAISSPANGLMVFQTDNPRGLYMYFTFHGTWTKVLNDSNLNLKSVLALGNDAGADSIFNLNALGIGVDTPLYPLHIQSDDLPQLFVEAASTVGVDARVNIVGHRNGTTGVQQAQLHFMNYDDDIGATNYLGTISGRVTDAVANTGDLVFYRYSDGTAQTEAMRIDSSGDVGINKSDPSARLHIQLNEDETAALKLEGYDTDAASSRPVITFFRNRGSEGAPTIVSSGDNLGGIIASGYDGSAESIAASIEFRVDGTPGTSDMPGNIGLFTSPDGSATRLERFRVTSNGDIGIGTTTPNVLLHLNESVGASTNDGAFIDIQNSSGISGSLSGIRFKNNSATTNIRYQGAIFHQWNANGYQFNFALRDNSATDVVDTDDIKMTINESGNVGIGVTNPTTPLAILGNSATNPVGITQNTSVGGGSTMEFTTADGSGDQATRLLLRGGNDNGDIEFYTGASGSESQLMHLESTNGRLGIGTNSPQRTLHAHDGSSTVSFGAFTTAATGQTSSDGIVIGYADAVGAAIFNYENSNLAFGTNGAYRMYLDPNGYLGIGEASPQGRLDVVDHAVIGNVTLGTESTAQTGSSVHAGDGFLTTPWIYSNAIEAQGERGASSALITIGNDGNYGANDEVHFVTNGASRMEVKSNGRVLIGGGSSNALLSVTSDDGDLNSGINLNNSSAEDWYMYQNLSNELVFRDDGTDRVVFTTTGTVTIGGAVVSTSDKRFKTNVQPITSALDKILQIDGITHYWDTLNFPEKGFNPNKNIGVLAQDVQKVFPELVYTDKDGFLHVDYPKFTAVLLQAIKEQQLLIDSQNQNNDKQQSEIDELRSEIKQMKERIVGIDEQ